MLEAIYSRSIESRARWCDVKVRRGREVGR